MNRVFLVGNITADIYFDRFLIQGKKRSFLRLILMAERPRTVRNLRVVLWDEKADLYFPYLKKGSELAVIGQFKSRQHKGKPVHEVVSENLLLLRNIDWAHGEQIRKKYNLPSPTGTTNNVFVVGRVMEGMNFDWHERSPERGGGKFAKLVLQLATEDSNPGLRVIVIGALAELAYPYLQTGSKIAVDGHIHTRNQDANGTSLEVTARNMSFLENINWEAGEAARLLMNSSDAEISDYEPVATGD